MKSRIVLAFLLVALGSRAQNFEKVFSFSSGNNTSERAFAGIEISGSRYLIGINDRVLCLSASGDSLWSKKYAIDEIDKIFRDPQNNLMLATRKGKMLIMKIDENNGDSLSSFYVPGQSSLFGYTVFDVAVAADGKYLVAYNIGGGDGGSLAYFTPGATTNIWRNDFAGQNFAPKSILIDDTSIVLAGYKRVAANFVNLELKKLSFSNQQQLSRQMFRNSINRDYLVGMQKNSSGAYLVATHWGIGSDLYPAIAKFAANGDSLAMEALQSHPGATNMSGLLFSLQKQGNAFTASGVINLEKTSPSQSKVLAAYMSVFNISDEGKFTGHAVFNNNPVFEISANSYSGNYCRAFGAFKSSDGYYLVYGEAGRLRPNPNDPQYFQAQPRGYVAKTQQLHTGLGAAPGLSEMALTLYPNPAKGVVYTGLSGRGDIYLYDLQGRLLYCRIAHNLAEAIVTEGMQAGMYLLRVQSQNATYTGRFVKQ